MKTLAAVTLFAALSVAPGAEAQVANLVGTWTHEGTQQELVIRSSIQFRPYSLPGDFNLGGSVGAGSATNTVIATQPTPTQVSREMALIIREDGAFSWVTKKSYAEGTSCQVELLQQNLGRVSVTGSEATFRTSEGSERASRSCNDRVTESDRAGRSETYRITRSGATLRVSDGTTTWVFRRHAG